MPRFTLPVMASAALCACLGCPSDFPSIGEAFGIRVAPQRIESCCDPRRGFPQVVGSFDIIHEGTRPVSWSVGLANPGLFLFEIDGAPEPAVSILDGANAPGETVTVRVSVTRCEEGQTGTFPLVLRQPDLDPLAPDREALVHIAYENKCPPRTGSSPAEPFLSSFGSLAGKILALDAGNETRSTFPEVAPRAPEPGQDLIGRGTAVQGLSTDELFALFRSENAVFPCGPGDEALTLCPEFDATPFAGDYLLFAARFAADIPLESDENSYQYAVVLDADGDPDNNFRADPDTSGDFFDNSDRFYQAVFSPAEGWRLRVTNARDGFLADLASGARLMIIGNELLLAVPAQELFDAAPDYRVTAFCSDEDLGRTPGSSWSGDHSPVVGEALAPFEP